MSEKCLECKRYRLGKNLESLGNYIGIIMFVSFLSMLVCVWVDRLPLFFFSSFICMGSIITAIFVSKFGYDARRGLFDE